MLMNGSPDGPQGAPVASVQSSPSGSVAFTGAFITYAYRFQDCGFDRSTAASPAGSGRTRKRPKLCFDHPATICAAHERTSVSHLGLYLKLDELLTFSGMFDPDQAPLEFPCPECGFFNTTTYGEARLSVPIKEDAKPSSSPSSRNTYRAVHVVC